MEREPFRRAETAPDAARQNQQQPDFAAPRPARAQITTVVGHGAEGRTFAPKPRSAAGLVAPKPRSGEGGSVNANRDLVRRRAHTAAVPRLDAGVVQPRI